MNRICWWCVDVAARLLEPDERDAVLGDFAESGDTGGKALWGLSGLIVRRQALLWKSWRPWLILIGLILPLAWLLSLASWLTAGGSAVYLWSYLNNWDWALLKEASFWYILRDAAVAVGSQCAMLACWSWSAGFLLGAVSPEITPVSGAVFCSTALVGELVGVSQYFAHWFSGTEPGSPADGPNGPVFALTFYREAFPVMVLVVLVAAPAIWAMRRGARIQRSLLLIRAVLLGAAVLALVGMTVHEPGMGFFLKANEPFAILHGWPVKLLKAVVYWPAVYFLLSTMGRKWRGIAEPI